MPSNIVMSLLPEVYKSNISSQFELTIFGILLIFNIYINCHWTCDHVCSTATACNTTFSVTLYNIHITFKI